MKKLSFVKEENNRWYVVLPEWEGDKEELEMVMGADVLLERLSNYGDTVRVKFDSEPFTGYQVYLSFQEEESGGGNYLAFHDQTMFNVWLCHVVKFVFGEIPKMIYCQAINQI